MTRPGPAAAQLGLLLVVLAAALACSGSSEPVVPQSAGPVEELPLEKPTVTPLEQQVVEIYYAAGNRSGLVGESHEIFDTATPGDRVKQILSDLISGPDNKKSLRTLPAGVRLRQVYVLDDGTAYLDFSSELSQGLGGGSMAEILAVYSIVNSVTANVPEVKRVGLLLEGRPAETLNGHIDVRRPLGPDYKLVKRKR